MSKDLYSTINEVLSTNSAGSSTSGLSSISGLNTSGGLDNTGVDGTVYKTPKVTGAKKRFGFGWELTPEIETTVKQVLSDKGIEADENDPQGLYKAYNTARLNDRIQASTELARKFGIAWDGKTTIADIKDVLKTMDKQTHAYHAYVDSYADRIAKINSNVVKNIWQNPDKFNNDNASKYVAWDIKDTGEYGTQRSESEPGGDSDDGPGYDRLPDWYVDIMQGDKSAHWLDADGDKYSDSEIPSHYTAPDSTVDPYPPNRPGNTPAFLRNPYPYQIFPPGWFDRFTPSGPGQQGGDTDGDGIVDEPGYPKPWQWLPYRQPTDSQGKPYKTTPEVDDLPTGTPIVDPWKTDPDFVPGANRNIPPGQKGFRYNPRTGTLSSVNRSGQPPQKNIPPGIDPDTGRPETSPKPVDGDGPIDPQDLEDRPFGPGLLRKDPTLPDQDPYGDETPGGPGSPFGLDTEGMPELGHDTGDIIPPWEVDPRPEKWPKRPGYDPNNPYPQLQPIPFNPNNPQTVPPLFPEPKPRPDTNPLSPNFKPYIPPMVIPPIGPGVVPNLLRPLAPYLRRLIPALAKTEQVEYNIQERFRYNPRTGILSSANRS